MKKAIKVSEEEFMNMCDSNDGICLVVEYYIEDKLIELS